MVDFIIDLFAEIAELFLDLKIDSFIEKIVVKCRKKQF